MKRHHISTSESDSYGCGTLVNAARSGVIAQLQEGSVQARVLMSPKEARNFARLLTAAADKVEKTVLPVSSPKATQMAKLPSVPEILTVKTCTKCGVEKPLEQFAPTKRGSVSRVSRCRVCDSAISRAWQKANPEKVNAAQAARRKSNPEKTRASKKAWQDANREKVRASNAAWQKANPPSVRAARKKVDTGTDTTLQNL
jgi:uncharacterized Zn finger protein (UPF0148 family)